MENCKNCFASIQDMRKETRCSTCNAPLHKDCAINDGGTFCDVCYTLKEEGESMQDKTIQIPEVIRRSYIETYNACPFQFYNEVILGQERPQTIYTQMGIDLHNLFDIASHGKITTPEEMKEKYKETFDSYTEELFGDVNKERMWKRAVDSIDTFFDKIRTMPKPFKTEETIQFSIGENLPQVQTTSDRINLIDGQLEMIDWKTGQVMVGQKLSSDLQAPLYIKGVQQKYGMTVRKFTFYYLEDNKERVFQRIDDDNYVCTVNKRQYFINITDAVRKVQSIFAQIIKGNFNIPTQTKHMYFTCKMCHLKDKGICRGADIESWKQYNKGGYEGA